MSQNQKSYEQKTFKNIQSTKIRKLKKISTVPYKLCKLKIAQNQCVRRNDEKAE